jgi:hypothetical protein
MKMVLARARCEGDFGIGPELLDPAPAAAERLRTLLSQAG